MGLGAPVGLVYPAFIVDDYENDLLQRMDLVLEPHLDGVCDHVDEGLKFKGT